MVFEYYLTNALQTWGFLEFILPFILIFTVVFAILQKIKIFGNDAWVKKINVAISLVMAAVTVIQHVLYPAINDPVTIINTALPQVSVVIIAILMALLLIGLLGKRFVIGDNSAGGWIATIAFLIIVYIFGSAADWWHLPWWLNFMADPDLQALVIVILVFGIIMWFITSEPKPAVDDEKTFMGRIGKMFESDKGK